MSVTDTKEKYGSTSKTLHWVILLLLIVQFSLGYVMTSLTQHHQLVKTLTWWHMSTGVMVLILATAFLIWRLLNTRPSLSGMPAWQRLIAHTFHGGLYFCLFLQPLLGITEVMLSGAPIAFFGLFKVPQILPTDKHLSGLIGGVHDTVAIVILVLVGLHVLAALYHEFVARDAILQRMLPETISKRLFR